MKIYTSLNIGEFHTNNCEDFFVNEPLSPSKRLIGVLDGCTMGEESVFASMLYGKILRNLAKAEFYQDFTQKSNETLKSKLKSIVIEMMIQAKSIKNQLGLETNEMLSTLVLGVVCSDSNTAEFITIGDGMILKDGEVFEYDQDDKPDYLGYHLSEDFEEWYNRQKQTLSVNSFKDLSICTDGIFTFTNLVSKQNQKEESEIINFLLIDNENSEYDNFLERKIRKLKDQSNHVVTDDLAIIRIKTTP